MKIGGKKVDFQPSSKIVVFPRQNDTIAFRVSAVLDRTEFDQLCPAPKPPMMLKRGGSKVPNTDSIQFKQAVDLQGRRFVNWLVIKAISVIGNDKNQPDPEFEWEKVKLTDPSTWHLWIDELKEAGFSEMERTRLQNEVFEVNSLSQDRLDEARESFLRLREEEPEESSSQNIEQDAMQSGEPVNGSALSRPEVSPVGTNLTKPIGGSKPV